MSHPTIRAVPLACTLAMFATAAAHAQQAPQEAPLVTAPRTAQASRPQGPQQPQMQMQPHMQMHMQQMQQAQPQQPPLRPCQSMTVDAPTTLALGKSRVVRLPFPAVRLVVGGQPTSRVGRPMPVGSEDASRAPRGNQGARPGDWDGVADTEITLISPTELYFLGRQPGSMNVVVQAADGRCLVKDIVVTIDPETIQAKLHELMPEESGVRVRAAENSIVLTGTVADALRLDQIMSIAGSYGDGKKVVNLLRVGSHQQVMLEVTIAEVSKSLLDRFGLDFTRLTGNKILSGIIGGGAGVLGRFSGGGGIIGNRATGLVEGTSGGAFSFLETPSRNSTLLGIDANNKDGIIRVLAEPNLMAISGQSASFLSGGKIFIPVAQSRDVGGTTITLEEKEFGVGLKFTPTVLDGQRINLKLTSEASELSQTGSPFTAANGVTAILPSMATRRMDTTVQLMDGQSFVVAGLIKNNLNGAIDRFPGLGEAPVMGALFRSTEFQSDQTELMFVVTPRLVRPISGPVTLPTDNHITPARGAPQLMGTGEGSGPPRSPLGTPTPAVVLPRVTEPAPAAPAAPAPAMPAPAAPATRPISAVPAEVSTPVVAVAPLEPAAAAAGTGTASAPATDIETATAAKP